MSERELARLFREAGRDLDDRQRKRIRELKGLQRQLFEELVHKLVDVLDQEQGAIKSRRGSASINQLVDQVFNALDRGGLRAFQVNSVKDLLSNLENVSAYFRGMNETMATKRYASIQRSVNSTMRRRLGIDNRGKRIEGGYLDSLFTSEAMRSEVKQVVAKAVQSGQPMAKLQEQLARTIKGGAEIDGNLIRYFHGFIFDQYQAFDRSTNTEYAKHLELDTFIYAGGLIETSRKFCIDRDNKVFSREEAEKWRRSCDLPRKKNEPKCPSAVVDYDPVVDLGRWNCRHRTRFISRELAEEMRPDLKP